MGASPTGSVVPEGAFSVSHVDVHSPRTRDTNPGESMSLCKRHGTQSRWQIGRRSIHVLGVERTTNVGVVRRAPVPADDPHWAPERRAQRLEAGQQIRADEVHSTVRACELSELEVPGPVCSHPGAGAGYGGRIFL
jgi:hypothetical protein